MATAAKGSNGTVWYSAKRCANGECVEVASREGQILIRDSKDPRGAVLAYSAEEWSAFIVGVKAGEFDVLGP